MADEVFKYRDAIKAVVGDRVSFGEPLHKHTTIKIGGPADAFITIETVDELKRLIDLFSQEGIRFAVIGVGSNYVCSDKGYEGAVICFGSGFSHVHIETDGAIAGAATPFRRLVEDTLDAGLVGLEIFGGIPGTVGGAVAMNAGTRTVWVDDFVESVEVCAFDGDISTLSYDDIDWGYRYSSLRDEYLILSVTFKGLCAGDTDASRIGMREAFAHRKSTQPLTEPNAGSIFRNPQGHSAGRLIDACGLKGLYIGGAKISEVHANFIVNTGGATSLDVKQLIEIVQEKVFNTYGVRLKTEIRFL